MDFQGMTTVEAAKALLGKKLVLDHGWAVLSGYIVETEAYLGLEDQACHAFGGRFTPRTQALYQAGGSLYIHLIHNHIQLNIVTRPEGVPEGVLIRGIEPAEGMEVMALNRGRQGFELTNGPGKLTQAFGITKALYGLTLGDCPLSIDEEGSKTPRSILSSGRIGIPNKGEWTSAPLRFYVAGNPYVSRMPKREMTAPEDSWSAACCTS